MSNLDEILDEMRELRKSGDAEIAHHRADELLCEAIVAMAERESAESFAQELVAHYWEVPRWYA